MNSMPGPVRRLRRFLLTLVLICPCVVIPAAADDSELDYPRRIEADGGTLTIHHPVIDRWDDFAVVEGWIPVEVNLPGSEQPWIGAVRARARTAVDLERRVVVLSDQEVLEVRFTNAAAPAAAVKAARSSIRGRPQTVLLAELLQLLAEDFELAEQGRFAGQFNRQPPRIVVSQSPLQLLLIDQEPVRAPIEGTGLEVVVNTDRDLFYETLSRSWWVINGGAWQTSALLAGGAWTTSERIPEDFRELAVGDRWSAVREALPAVLPETEPTPFLVSLEATELIVTDGEPRLGVIPGTAGLREVVNTESNLFELEGRWYFLAAGRWFTAAKLEGRWEAAKRLPDAFGDIPASHRRGPVRAFVPGTVEARMALVEAALPRYVSLPADAGPGETVVYVGAPRFEPIPNTRVERAVNTPYAVIRHNNLHYLCFGAAWYLSRNPEGPWRVALSLPEEIYAIPPSDPLHYVTYLRPAPAQEATDRQARFVYNAGYEGIYTDGAVVVQGTGWGYTPWIGHPGGQPVYWGHPWTYGWHHWGRGYHYNPQAYYGAYWGRQTITVHSPSRGVGGEAAASEQDPRKARRGYDYTTLAEQRAAAVAGLDAGDDLYADADGDVYRRGDEGWSRHTGDGWSTMAELERQYGSSSVEPAAPDAARRQAYRQNPDDIERMQRYYERRSRSYNIHANVYVGR